MDKPKMKQEAAVDWISADSKKICFYCQPDALSDFKTFGYVEKWIHENQYLMYVDARFDYAQVAAYINNYGKEQP